MVNANPLFSGKIFLKLLQSGARGIFKSTDEREASMDNSFGGQLVSRQITAKMKLVFLRYCIYYAVIITKTDIQKYPLIYKVIHKKFKELFSFPIVAAFLILSGTVACKSTENTQTQASTDETPELEQLYWSRIDSSRMSFTEADVKFMRGMIAHHAQALIMSRLAPENGASKDILTLAARIINAQKDEIKTMQQWLRDRDQPVPSIEIDGLNLMIEINGEPFTMYRNMPGVLSQNKLEELAAAKGDEFDRLFLKYMIEHHAGAVHMVDNLFGTDGAAQDEAAFRLASDIQVDQRTEIERMRMMLNNLPESD